VLVVHVTNALFVSGMGELLLVQRHRLHDDDVLSVAINLQMM
jgi:hypothetical protein